MRSDSNTAASRRSAYRFVSCRAFHCCSRSSSFIYRETLCAAISTGRASCAAVAGATKPSICCGSLLLASSTTPPCSSIGARGSAGISACCGCSIRYSCAMKGCDSCAATSCGTGATKGRDSCCCTNLRCRCLRARFLLQISSTMPIMKMAATRRRTPTTMPAVLLNWTEARFAWRG
jgi:hypothetical protein